MPGEETTPIKRGLVHDLAEAFVNTHPDVELYFDLDELELVAVPHEYVAQNEEHLAEIHELEERILEKLGVRYFELPKLESSDMFAMVEEFIESVGKESIRDKLNNAINSTGAYPAFLEALSDYHSVNMRWHKFQEEELTKKVLAWLEELGLKPKLQKRT